MQYFNMHRNVYVEFFRKLFYQPDAPEIAGV